MVKICVKVNGWKRYKLHKIISFPDSMLKELELAESQGMIAILLKPEKKEKLKNKLFTKYDNINNIVKEGDNNAT